MPHDLDSREFVTRLDPNNVFGLFEAFPEQCRKAAAIGESADLPYLDRRPNCVALTGMGGSAAGGDFARALFEAQAPVPFIVNRDYHLPSFIGLGDVVFCASYSGGTEETLSAYEDAKKAGARIVAITSGGELEKRAKADDHVVVKVPGGQPPRTALGLMLIPVLIISQRLKLLPDQPYSTAFDLCEQQIKELTVEAPFDRNSAKQLAQELHGALPIVYGLGSWQGLVAGRWRGQINENAKNLAFVNAYPELNHNEVLGWVGAPSQGVHRFVGIRLEDGSESDKMKARARVTESLIGETAQFHSVKARGESLLEKMLSLASYGDFVSLYLAALNGVNPEDIGSIDKLKAELAKV